MACPWSSWLEGRALAERLYRLSRSLRCAAITPGLFAISFFMIYSGDRLGRSALSGSRAKSNPESFPCFGCVSNTGEEGSALAGLNTSELSCGFFYCSGRVALTCEGCCASGYCVPLRARSEFAPAQYTVNCPLPGKSRSMFLCVFVACFLVSGTRSFNRLPPWQYVRLHR